MSNELYRQGKAGPTEEQGLSDTGNRHRGNQSRDELETIVKAAALIGFTILAYIAFLVAVGLIALTALIVDRCI